MNLPALLSGLALTVLSTWSWAGGTAVLEAGAGANRVSTTIEFHDGNMRMGAAMPGLNGYMVMTDTGIYMVTAQAGRPMVLDLGAMMSMLGGMAGEMMQSQGFSVPNGIGQFLEMSDTGREEVVAGIPGRVYDLSYVNDRGTRQTEEIVLGRDDTLRELTDTMATWSRMMAAYLSIDLGDYQSAMDDLLPHGDGILRLGSGYRLVSINNNAPDSSRFTLPAAPQQMPSWMP
ncbi:hypothetical protein [Pseudohongiella sp.]|uniref:DUF4412 domain-containing protein n=1 Tax=marine sediment metagenome TaxID=412755 RepID=A0A0F9V522_9ZZZZ|nr:hypothetical protein [Pseudohongiella sp.]HDZ08937.1 hypothetical protein [Pseudohongiella sp.]HEA63985.1 hypothetical protein [Pseudohongiella sp.]